MQIQNNNTKKFVFSQWDFIIASHDLIKPQDHNKSIYMNLLFHSNCVYVDNIRKITQKIINRCICADLVLKLLIGPIEF